MGVGVGTNATANPPRHHRCLAVRSEVSPIQKSRRVYIYIRKSSSNSTTISSLRKSSFFPTLVVSVTGTVHRGYKTLSKKNINVAHNCNCKKKKEKKRKVKMAIAITNAINSKGELGQWTSHDTAMLGSLAWYQLCIDLCWAIRRALDQRCTPAVAMLLDTRST